MGLVLKKEYKMVTQKQIEQCLDILISKVDRINERTKKHTKEIKDIEKKLNQIQLRANGK